jgi:hypothetical protein
MQKISKSFVQRSAKDTMPSWMSSAANFAVYRRCRSGSPQSATVEMAFE